MVHVDHPTVRRFHQLYYEAGNQTWHNTFWFGTLAQKCPLDLWIYQEILVETHPDLIIETGTMEGGSARFMASILDLLGNGEVISIDIEEKPWRPLHPRITYLTGSSTDPDILAQVAERARDKASTMVILDSDHSEQHVLQELRVFSPLVTPGNYLIVEDTNVNGNPVLPDFGPGPSEALEIFLAENADFTRDPHREKLLMTFNPGGFLKKRSRHADDPPRRRIGPLTAPNPSRIAERSSQRVSAGTTIPPEMHDEAVRGLEPEHAQTGRDQPAETDRPPATISWRGADGAGGTIVIDGDGRPRIELDPAGTASGTELLAEEPTPAFQLAVSIPARTAEGAPSFDEAGPSAASLYLDLMKKCLTRIVFKESGPPIDPASRGFDAVARAEGRDWPADAETMAGMLRLENVQQCVVDALRRGVPGDLIETGVWRGGTTIFMRAILAAYGDETRRVWVADSFQGLPKPDAARYPADEGWDLSHFPQLAISQEQVQENFARYGLLDDRVHFLKGWFKDTLPAAPITRLAVMRLDGDLYESTMDALTALYPKLSPGGYVIVDDYGAIPACRQAVHDYRTAHGIEEPIHEVDWTGAFWRRET